MKLSSLTSGIALTSVLVLTTLVACGDDSDGPALQAEDDFVGEIVVDYADGSDFTSLDYTITLTAVDGDTLAVSGADFTTFEVDVEELGGQLVAVGDASAFLYADDTLQIAWEGEEEEVTFNGTRVGSEQDDTGDTGDTDW